MASVYASAGGADSHSGILPLKSVQRIENSANQLVPDRSFVVCLSKYECTARHRFT
jgi:hypothetical protein